jgi:hypothetical protein
MYTTMLYEAERTRTPQEQRELNTVNGEIALAIRRPFRWLMASRYTARPAARSPRNGGQLTMRVGPFPSDPTIPEARCN